MFPLNRLQSYKNRRLLHVPPVFYSRPGYMYILEYTPCSPCFLLPSRIHVNIGVLSIFHLFSTSVQDICLYRSILHVPPVFYSRPEYMYISEYTPCYPCFQLLSRIYVYIGVYSMFPLFSTPVHDICIYRSIIHVPPVFYSRPGYMYILEYTPCSPCFLIPSRIYYISEYTPCSPCFLLPSRVYVNIGVYSMFPLFSTPVLPASNNINSSNNLSKEEKSTTGKK